MEKKFVKATFNLHCDKRDTAPAYRIFFNDELFTERTWRWDPNFYLKQILQIEAVPGEYTVKITSVNAEFSVFCVENHGVDYGDAYWENDKLIIRS